MTVTLLPKCELNFRSLTVHLHYSFALLCCRFSPCGFSLCLHANPQWQRFASIDSELDAHLGALQCDVRHSVAAHLSAAHSALLDDVTELVGVEVQRHVDESVWPAIEVRSVCAAQMAR